MEFVGLKPKSYNFKNEYFFLNVDVIIYFLDAEFDDFEKINSAFEKINSALAF